jgi:hypothetical protein
MTLGRQSHSRIRKVICLNRLSRTHALSVEINWEGCVVVS